MYELTVDEIDITAGSVNWSAAGNALMALGGAAVLLGAPEVGAVLGVAAIICFVAS